MKIPPRLVAPILFFVYKLWCKTLRITVEGREAVNALERAGTPMMFALWHDEIFPLIFIRKTLKIITIVSQSNDGEYLALILEALGFKTARGSSSRGGLKALLKMSKVMREEQYNGCISVDGPRGPRHKVKEGAIFLAKKTPAPIVPARMFAAHAITFSSWDKFQLPLPFSRVHMVFGAPYTPQNNDLSSDTIKEDCTVLEEKLQSLAPPEDFFAPEKTITYRLCSPLVRLLQKMPLSVLHVIGSVLGHVFWWVAKKRKNMACTAIQKHLKVSEAQAKVIAKKSIISNFKSFLEIFYTKHMKDNIKELHFHDSPGLKSFFEEKGPIVVTTGHLGAWELIAPFSMAHDSTNRLVVVRRQKNRGLNLIMQELRMAAGINSVDHRNATQESMQCLRANGLVGFLVDHNTNRKEAVFLPFLEDIAAVNQGPALIALRAKAKVFPAFLIRSEKNEFDIFVDTPLDTTTLSGSIREKTHAIATHYTHSVEKYVRLFPEQWFWIHKRWKTRQFDD